MCRLSPENGINSKKIISTDENHNAVESEDKESKQYDLIVATSDNWISRFLYGGPIGLTVNFGLLTAITVNYCLTIDKKLEDTFYRENTHKPSVSPLVPQLFNYTLSRDIAMMAVIICILYPLSRLSRSTVYYWIIGASCAMSMYAIVWYDSSRGAIPIKLLTVVDATRLCMKLCAFLVECKNSDLVFEKSSAKSLLYYLLIPHLIYKHEYPRAARTRWIKVLGHLWWIWVGLHPFASFMIEYFAHTPVDMMKMTSYSEVWLRMATLGVAVGANYGLVVWFFIFDNFCGLHGELLRFPDLRLFDIRNLFNGSKLATEINIIVSKWLSRYVYVPAIKSTGSRFKSLLLTISLSFIFHDVCTFYFLGVSMMLVTAFVCIVGPTFLSMRIRSPWLNALIGVFLATLLMNYCGAYVLEYFAWNYSSMPGVDKMSKLRLIPLFVEQLMMRKSV